ncbi:MAG: hypothetical protein JWQ71_3792 [Pedosphaera sp.]|nr:hypothetical protein [Pedosphaera sp.]
MVLFAWSEFEVELQVASQLILRFIAYKNQTGFFNHRRHEVGHDFIASIS